MTYDIPNHHVLVHICKVELNEINMKWITKKFIGMKGSFGIGMKCYFWVVSKLKICLLHFIYCYCSAHLFSMFPFTIPWNHQKTFIFCNDFRDNWKKIFQRKRLILPWGVFHKVRMQFNPGFLTPFSSWYAHLRLWDIPFPLPPTYNGYIKFSCLHHLTHNAFKYLSKKSYKTLNQLKNNRKQ